MILYEVSYYYSFDCDYDHEHDDNCFFAMVTVLTYNDADVASAAIDADD